MRCPNCGHDNREGHNFRGHCGGLDAALEQLEQAASLFGEMEMSWWAEKAEALRGRLEAGAPFRGFAPCVDG